ncbi:hypothetical protein SDC9_106638 [bioreactor metagenome]|uniref:Uncharacterized protein n=1 Tax=bioreactor metagenome TaxID=1076179 RepID=A0A645B2W6_9ZZZZ
MAKDWSITVFVMVSPTYTLFFAIRLKHHRNINIQRDILSILGSNLSEVIDLTQEFHQTVIYQRLLGVAQSEVIQSLPQGFRGWNSPKIQGFFEQWIVSIQIHIDKIISTERKQRRRDLQNIAVPDFSMFDPLALHSVDLLPSIESEQRSCQNSSAVRVDFFASLLYLYHHSAVGLIVLANLEYS